MLSQIQEQINTMDSDPVKIKVMVRSEDEPGAAVLSPRSAKVLIPGLAGEVRDWSLRRGRTEHLQGQAGAGDKAAVTERALSVPLGWRKPPRDAGC